jgi:hypothetical protein
MGSKKFTFLVAILMLISAQVFSQAHLSEAEVQDFFRLIKETKQYKQLQVTVDSFNASRNEQVEEIKTEIYVGKNAPVDVNIAAAIVRIKALGLFPVQTVYYYYNQRTRKLVAGR